MRTNYIVILMRKTSKNNSSAHPQNGILQVPCARLLRTTVFIMRKTKSIFVLVSKTSINNGSADAHIRYKSSHAINFYK
jgi:hypothetical protein